MKTDLSKLTPKELEAYASGILKKSRGKPEKKRDSRPVGFGGKRRRPSRKQKAV